MSKGGSQSLSQRLKARRIFAPRVPHMSTRDQIGLTPQPNVAEKLVQGLEGGRLSRREFVARATAAGLSTGLIGTLISACGSSGSSTGSTGTTAAGLPVAGEGKRGGVAQIATAAPSQKASLDPIRMASDPEQFMTGLIYDPLVNVDETTWAIKPGLAEKWEIGPGARSWTFGLREGVTFHDGKPLTSADVVYSIKRHLNPKEGSALQARLSSSVSASGITAVDKHTVQVKLNKPDAYFPVALSYCWAGIVPVGHTDEGIGTGPFKVVSWKPGQGFDFARNDAYWVNERPFLDTVRCIVINDPTAKVQSVIAGQSHITDYVEPSDAESAAGSGTAILVNGAAHTAFQPLVFPTKAKPFDNPLVIKAVKLAVDRKKMVEIGLAGRGVVVGDVIVPPTDPAYPAGLSTAQDIEGAKSLLKEAGYANGLPITLHVADAASHMVDLAVTFAETVKPAGINVKVQKVPVATYFEQFFLGTRPFIDWWNREQVLDNASLLYRKGAPFNETDFASVKFGELLDSGQAQTDPKMANKYFAEAMKVMSEETSHVVAGYSNEILVAKSGFHSEPSLRYIVDFRNAYLD